MMRCNPRSAGLMAFLILVAIFFTTCAGASVVEKVLHYFRDNGTDGFSPEGGLIFDASGNLYGTTYSGGASGNGTVFELTPVAGGWAEKVLHSFSGADGSQPTSSLVFDDSGNLYGTTFYGGANGVGTVFELTPRADGNWAQKVLHSFSQNGIDGANPYSDLTFDASGNIYGTTSYGGSGACVSFSNGCGTVFELTPKAGGAWAEKVILSFSDSSTGPFSPQFSGVIFDVAGNLYGTTFYGGKDQPCYHKAPKGCGTVFELTPKTGGGWTEKVVHAFRKDESAFDGTYPRADLIFDAVGNLYGTTSGANGTVFELSPLLEGNGMRPCCTNSNMP
jgi:uncharacterized repeat protein (TIGR03803 family)